MNNVIIITVCNNINKMAVVPFIFPIKSEQREINQVAELVIKATGHSLEVGLTKPPYFFVRILCSWGKYSRATMKSF